MKRPPAVIDAEFEVVETGEPPPPEKSGWRIYSTLDKRTLLFVLAFGVLGVVKILLTGSLLGY